MMLGEIVGEVVTSSSPVNDELPLFDSVLDPIKSHVDRLGSALLDGLVYDAGRTSVIGLNRSGSLWVAEFFEYSAKHGSIFGVVKETAHFCFSR